MSLKIFICLESVIIISYCMFIYGRTSTTASEYVKFVLDARTNVKTTKHAQLNKSYLCLQ
jgi:hypothetical protein